MVGIYKITNPKGRVYIGQSVNISKRKNYYRNSCSKRGVQPKISNSIKKYGWDNHSFEVIEECRVEELDKREIYWINFYNSIQEGMNIREGGGQGKLHLQTIEKMRKGATNNKIILQYDLENNFVKKYLSIASAEREYGTGIKEVLIGKTKTAHGFIWRYEYQPLDKNYKLNLYVSNRKKVNQYTKDGEFIKTWDSLTEVQRETGFKNPNLSSCCTGKTKTAYGFIWRYED